MVDRLRRHWVRRAPCAGYATAHTVTDGHSAPDAAASRGARRDERQCASDSLKHRARTPTASRNPRPPPQTSWVYDPEELVAYRPKAGPNPAWRVDTSSVLTYQTLYVASAGRVPSTPTAIDTLAFWNEKPGGISGVCSLIGFNAANGPPDLSGRAPHTWRANLSNTCLNINGWTPFTRFALSADGATAVAWVQQASLDVTLFAFDGQTGARRWTVTLPAPPQPDRDYFISLGISISADGAWVVADEGVEGGGDGQRLHVLSAVDGTPRCATVDSAGMGGFMQPTVSDDGRYVLNVANDATGAAGLYVFNSTLGRYALVGYADPPAEAPGGNGWVIGGASLSREPATNVTYAGIAWFDRDLGGSSLVAMFDAANPAAGPVTTYAVQPVAGDDIAVAAAAIACDGGVCVAGLWVQVVNGTQPAVAVLSASSPSPVFTFVSPGSTDAVDIVSAGAGAYYVAAAGCATYGVCTDPGSDAYMWRVQL